MSFMEAQITELQQWICLDGSVGIVSVQADIVGVFTVYDDINKTLDSLQQYYPGKLHSWTNQLGYGVRTSAPGFLDCTDWEVFRRKKDAVSRYHSLKRELGNRND